MNNKPASEPVLFDVPYDVFDPAAVVAFWDQGIAHRGLMELRATLRAQPDDAEFVRESVRTCPDSQVQ